MNRGRVNGHASVTQCGTTSSSVASIEACSGWVITHQLTSASAPAFSAGSMYTQPKSADSPVSSTA